MFKLPVYIMLIFSLGCAAPTKSVKDENLVPDVEPKKEEKVVITDVVLGVGDTIDISVFRNDELKKSQKIDSTGIVMFPLIGDVRVVGRGVLQIRDELRERLSKYVVDPQVSINVTSMQSQKVMVLGEVNAPGIFALDSELTIMEAITKAGGMTDDAKMNNVLLIRKETGKTKVTSLDMKKALKEGDLGQNVALKSGDIVYLPAVKIADVSWYFGHLSRILSPIVSLETGIVLWPQVQDVLTGKDGGADIVFPSQ